MKTVLKIVLGIVLGFTVLIVGCVAIIGAGVDKAQKDSDKAAITRAEYASVKAGPNGNSRKRIESRFGEPQSSDDVQAEGVKGIPESDFSQSCIYYSRKGELASLYQFCFDGNGRLRSKASY